ncbi:helix-turn-helix transcriptional regulator [Leptolyngbya sp. DQ-M1]|uniref:helix-turn-helix domain-containing protein n=1 Tax=Leptolyngbya sp. DQ-M1 TaxID=2933920 RepID=UPI00329866E6
MQSGSWIFRVEPHSDESFGHFMGRFRRANELSHRAIAEQLGIRIQWVQSWDSPSRRRNPTPLQMIALSKLTDVAPEQLAKMLPSEPLHLQTRLCSVCYAEVPVHRSTWQRANVELCDQHSVQFLSACPECHTGLRTPALWEDDCCEKCGLPFAQMLGQPKPKQERSEASLLQAVAPKRDRKQLSKRQQ